MNEVRRALRDATQRDHERVDLAFAGFALSSRPAYTAFLSAHAAVLPQAEARVAAAGLWPHWPPRAPALAEDLADLGAPTPAALDLVLPWDRAGLWGLLYVLEGSRLGGGVLAGRIGGGLPRRYLSSRHPPGAWAAFQVALEAARDPADDSWIIQCIAGARLSFDAFEAAGQAYVGQATFIAAD